MYLEHFNIAVKPFALSTDPHFLWVGANQRQALATLDYGLKENKGIVVLGGEFGTGKTTLVNAFVKDLQDDVLVAQLSEPGPGTDDLLQSMAEGFGLRNGFSHREELIPALRDRAGNDQGTRHRLLLVIDEAQGLTAEMQAEVLHLARQECRGTPLLHILLVGQNEVYQWFADTPRQAFIRQVSATCKLHPLSEAETSAYIDHRLRIAGATRTPFSPGAVSAIHTLSRGLPRAINLLCDFSLLHAHLKGSEQVDSTAVDACKDRLQIACLPDTAPSEVAVREIAPVPVELKDVRRPNRRRSLQLAVPFLLLIIAGGYFFAKIQDRNPPLAGKTAALQPPAPESPPLKQPPAPSASTPSTAVNETQPPATPPVPVEKQPDVEPSTPQKASPPTQTDPAEGTPPATARVVTAGAASEFPAGAAGDHTDESASADIAGAASKASGEVQKASITEDGTAPEVAVATQQDDANTLSADIKAEVAAPPADTEKRNADDPGAIIDWLIREKHKDGEASGRPTGNRPRPVE